MNKLAWVLAPLLLAALAAAVLAWHGRLPGRSALNAWSSLLLLDMRSRTRPTATW